MAVQAGITVVGPMGNSLTNPVHDIAAVPEAIGVGGIWNDGPGPAPNFCDDTRYRHPAGPVRWGFPGQWFTKPDLVVPAHGVAKVSGSWSCRRQTCDATGYHFAITEMGGGTSLATPIVSGLVALLLEKNNELMPAEIRNALEGTARDLGVPGKDNDFGAGVPQIDEALKAVNFLNNFDHFIEPHAVQDGGMPTNWTFEVSDPAQTPNVDIVDLTPGYNPCIPEPNRPEPQAGLQIASPNGHRTLGYAWEPREDHLFSFRMKFAGDSNKTRSVGALLRWDPVTKDCVYVRTHKADPQDPTTTEFVFGREESGTPHLYATIPHSEHQFDFEDTSKEYFWTIEDHDNRVTLLVGEVGGNPVQIFSLPTSQPTTVPTTFKGLFAQNGAIVVFDDVTIEDGNLAIGVTEALGMNFEKMVLSVPSVSSSRVTPFEVQKPSGTGIISVFDVKGRLVSRMNLPVEAGSYVVHWDGRSTRGFDVSSGVYFVHAVSGALAERQKLVLVR